MCGVCKSVEKCEHPWSQCMASRGAHCAICRQESWTPRRPSHAPPTPGAASAMTYTTEEFVRRELRSILRGDTYRTRSVCLTCLVTMTRERLHPGWRKSEITRALDRIDATPGTSMTFWGGGRVCSLPKNNALPRRGRLIVVEATLEAAGRLRLQDVTA